MGRASRVAAVVVIGVLLLAAGAYGYMKFAMGGFSARAEPSNMEEMMAYARDTAMPASAKNLKNPVVLTHAVQHEAMAHFADHCAVCHSNNGSGQLMFGKGHVSQAARPERRDPEHERWGDLLQHRERHPHVWSACLRRSRHCRGQLEAGPLYSPPAKADHAEDTEMEALNPKVQKNSRKSRKKLSS